MSSPLAGEDDPYIHSCDHVFVQARPQVLGSLLLVKVVKHTQLRLVFRTAHNLLDTVVGELGVGWRAITGAVEAGLDAQSFGLLQRIPLVCCNFAARELRIDSLQHEVRLALIAAGGGRSPW